MGGTKEETLVVLVVVVVVVVEAILLDRGYIGLHLGQPGNNPILLVPEVVNVNLLHLKIACF